VAASAWASAWALCKREHHRPPCCVVCADQWTTSVDVAEYTSLLWSLYERVLPRLRAICTFRCYTDAAATAAVRNADDCRLVLTLTAGTLRGRDGNEQTMCMCLPRLRPSPKWSLRLIFPCHRRCRSTRTRCRSCTWGASSARRATASGSGSSRGGGRWRRSRRQAGRRGTARGACSLSHTRCQ
jgi:hypothetical protein